MSADFVLWNSGTDQATTASFVDLGAKPVFAKLKHRATTVVVNNTGGTNGISYQVLASHDQTNWIILVASANVALSAAATATITDYWPYLKVQVKDQVGGSHSTVNATFASIAC